MNRVDFHSHILPGADHGSRNTETSQKQLALLAGAGVTHLVATPHFYPTQSSVAQFLDLRAGCAEALRGVLTAEHPTVYLGAEVLLCPGIEDMDGFERLCIEGTGVMLLELPYQRLNNQLFYTVESITNTTSVSLVLAHIDRYHPDDIADLMNLPLFGQVNAESLCERKNRGWLKPYFEAGRVTALGSDLHGCENDATKRYLKGLSKLGEKKETAVNGAALSLLRGAVSLNTN